MTTIDADILSAGGMTYDVKSLAPNYTLHVITLTKDKTLNALTPSTFVAFHKILDAVEAPCTVLLRSVGRAFSAGGDVREVRKRALEAGPIGSTQREKSARKTLKAEYDFLRRFHALGHGDEGVVTVGICNGYAFGAGLGLLQACRVRLVTKRATFSMPEVRIGLIPDCGATWFYTKMEGCVGMYASLTAARISAGDALALGLADGAVEEGWDGTGIGQGVTGALDCATTRIEKGELAEKSSEVRRWIDECFSASSLKEVTEKVTQVGGEWADQVLKEMGKGSPTAMEECFKGLREGYNGGGLEEALSRELRIDSKLGAQWDFEEGVRALLIDKDNNPKWQ